MPILCRPGQRYEEKIPKRINKRKSETKRKIPHFDSNCENSSKKIVRETVAMLKTAVCSRIRNKSFCFKGNF